MSAAESKMPAKIWTPSESAPYSTPYIRADLIEPLVEALDNLQRATQLHLDTSDAPGATTKPDGGARSLTADETRLVEQALRDSGELVESLPGPSSTRSDVTVDELEVWLLENLRLDADPHQDARALLDQFEIRKRP